MKNAIVLETYDEVKNAMMSGKDISFEIVVDCKETEQSSEQTLKIGDPYYIDGKPVGVRAASINGRVVVLALQDEPEQMNWYDAVKKYENNPEGWRLPTKEEWGAIFENLEAIDKAFVRAGKKPLEKEWYWSSSEYSNYSAWTAYLGNSGLGYDFKNYYHGYVVPVLTF